MSILDQLLHEVRERLAGGDLEEEARGAEDVLEVVIGVEERAVG